MHTSFILAMMGNPPIGPSRYSSQVLFFIAAASKTNRPRKKACNRPTNYDTSRKERIQWGSWFVAYPTNVPSNLPHPYSDLNYSARTPSNQLASKPQPKLACFQLCIQPWNYQLKSWR